jgi:hypothetical protein
LASVVISMSRVGLAFDFMLEGSESGLLLL